jgi:histone RNA hairpin-binding protein
METTSETEVHRVPPSTHKRHGSARKEAPHAKRHKKFNKAETKSQCSDASRPPASPMDCEAQFQKLDPKDPAHAKRMAQRIKTISKGENTAGYECYIKQVPKEKRRLRSMETPMTPDATLDIPAKRWQGLVKAW